MFIIKSQVYVFIVLVKISFTECVSLKEAKAEVCTQGAKITAIVDDRDDKEVAFLFSGKYVFSLDIDDFVLEEVKTIGDEFYGLEGPILGALYNLLLVKYVFVRKDDVLLLDVKKTLTPWSEKDFNEAVKKMGAKYFPRFFTCGTSYYASLYEIVTIAVNKEGVATRCVQDKQGTTGPQYGCKQSDKGEIPNPNGVEQSNFQGSTCEGLFIENVGQRDANSSVRYRMVVADKHQLRVWNDHELKHKKSFTELFECSNAAFYIFIGVVVVVTLLVFIVIASFVVYAVRNRRRSSHAEESTYHPHQSKTTLNTLVPVNVKNG